MPFDWQPITVCVHRVKSLVVEHAEFDVQLKPGLYKVEFRLQFEDIEGEVVDESETETQFNFPSESKDFNTYPVGHVLPPPTILLNGEHSIVPLEL